MESETSIQNCDTEGGDDMDMSLPSTLSPYKPIPCEHCSAKFSSKKVYNRHVREVHLKLRIPCPKCKKPFSRLTRMKKHSEKCDGGPSSCHICKQEFNSSELLTFHMQQIHDIQFREEKVSKDDSSDYIKIKALNHEEAEDIKPFSQGSKKRPNKAGSTGNKSTGSFTGSVNGDSAKSRKRKCAYRSAKSKQSQEANDIPSAAEDSAYNSLYLLQKMMSIKTEPASEESNGSGSQVGTQGSNEDCNSIEGKRRRLSSTGDGNATTELENPLQQNGFVDNPLLQLISRGIDEAESFALSLVPTFRQLSPEKLQLAKIQINQLLFDLAYRDKFDVNR